MPQHQNDHRRGYPDGRQNTEHRADDEYGVRLTLLIGSLGGRGRLLQTRAIIQVNV